MPCLSIYGNTPHADPSASRASCVYVLVVLNQYCNLGQLLSSVDGGVVREQVPKGTAVSISALFSLLTAHSDVENRF
jgi:hypothetical protein